MLSSFFEDTAVLSNNKKKAIIEREMAIKK